MPRLVMATLAHGAQDVAGLVSMLSGFIEAVSGPQLPLRQNLWLVSRLEVDTDELGQAMLVVVRVEHSDGEQLARVDANLVAQRSPAYSVELPVGVNLVVPLSLEFRREGLYRVTVSADGEVLGGAALVVSAQLPAL
ncbi:MAG: DUF6941 family protein [Acidimicrobiales bacterium]